MGSTTTKIQKKIESYPTIYYKNGDNATEYSGSRDVDSLVTFFEQTK